MEFFYFQLGLTDIFTINSNLGGITLQNSTLTVSDILHKAELEVNEKGGTASAVTGTCLLCTFLMWRTQSHLTACPCGFDDWVYWHLFKITVNYMR
jgi:serine protease inhibitor